MRFLLIAIAFCTGTVVAEENINFQWMAKNKSKVIHNTDFGSIFNFASSNIAVPCNKYSANKNSNTKIKAEEFLRFTYQHDILCTNCSVCQSQRINPIEIKLFANEKAAKKLYRRYLCIDFKIRRYPIEIFAFKPFKFKLITTAKLNGFSSYKDINYEYDSELGLNVFSKYSPKSLKTDDKKIHNAKELNKVLKAKLNTFSITSGNIQVAPNDFDVKNFRFVFDTAPVKDKKNLVQLDNINWQIIEIVEDNKSLPPMPIMTIGIIVPEDGTLLEVSNAEIHFSDNIGEIITKHPQTEARYNYKKTEVQVNNNVQNKFSADNIYAAALEKIYGDTPDFVAAFSLLKKAAKSGHILAKYELALGAYRNFWPVDKYNECRRMLSDCLENKMEKAINLNLAWNTDKIYITSNLKNNKRININANDWLPYTGIDIFQTPKSAYLSAIETMLNTIKNVSILQMDFQKDAEIHKYFRSYCTGEKWHDVKIPFAEQVNSMHSFAKIDYAIKEKYIPAIKYKAKVISYDADFWEKCQWKKFKESDSLELWNLAIKYGDNQAELEKQLWTLQNNKKININFENSIQTKFFTEPLFYLLKDLLKNPQKINLFKNDELKIVDDFYTSINNTPENTFLYAMHLLYLKSSPNFIYATNFNRNFAEEFFQKIMINLESSAKNGHVAASYFYGKFLLKENDEYQVFANGQIKKPLDDRNIERKGMNYIIKAANADFIPAVIFLLQKKYFDNKTSTKMLEQIVKKHPLSSEILELKAEYSNLLADNQKAFEAGSILSTKSLGYIYYQKKDFKKAGFYWSKMREMDAFYRNNDIKDLYFGTVKSANINNTLCSCEIPFNCIVTPEKIYSTSKIKEIVYHFIVCK